MSIKLMLNVLLLSLYLAKYYNTVPQSHECSLFVLTADASILVVGTHTDKTNMMMNCVPSHVQEVIGRTPHVYTSSVTGFGISYLWHKLLRNKSELTEGHNIIDSNKTSVHRSRSNSTPVASSKSMRKVLRKTSALLLCSSKYHTL